MKELDFDELDRAVNTLMSDVPKTPAPQADDDTTTTLDIPTTLSDDQPVPDFTPSVELVASSVTSPRSVPVPAARRGGRFMDVVHPSSDMKSVAAPARPVSRQGVTIASNSVDQPVETTTPAPVIDEAPVATVEPQAWPDPLDMVGYQREPDTTTPSVEVSVPEFVPAAPIEELATPAVVDEATLDEEQPLLTPFLSDAKVEKRPLGTNSTEEPDHAPVSNTVVPESETPNAEDQLSAMPELSPVVLPAELQTDVLSIESDTTTHTAQDALMISPNETASEIKTEVAPEAAVLTGPTSIQQQYTEQPSTGDQTTGGIYDTDSYHQPLAHPAKKKSGWVWLIWVIVLLILGAAGGAIAYLYLLK